MRRALQALSATGLEPTRVNRLGARRTPTTLGVRETAGVDPMWRLVLWCIHQKVFEAFWDEGETFPSRVICDDVLN